MITHNDYFSLPFDVKRWTNKNELETEMRPTPETHLTFLR
jgi:hypothetical protein